MGRVVMEVITGDCLEVMPTLDENSVDAIVTDPPYGLSFMGKAWDHAVPGVEFWAEALRVAKPGAHLLAFGGTRLYHRLACAIEDAEWEVRDCLMWLYGSGFPKSLDVSKAIDKAAGAEREAVGKPYRVPDAARTRPHFVSLGDEPSATIDYSQTAPATDAAKQWNGWGTALKPAWEPVILARKPLDGTVANNVQTHGCGGLNIDGCRVEGDDHAKAWDKPVSTNISSGSYVNPQSRHTVDLSKYKPSGRWPANLILDEEAGAALPNNASRFFYCPKSSKADRDAGVAGVAGVGALRDGGRESEPRSNPHPTVKPTDLMAYLCRLVAPPGGTVLDPFTGSGSTGKACAREGFDFIGIEMDPAHADVARQRIKHEQELLTGAA